jgi:hypothetical protein
VTFTRRAVREIETASAWWQRNRPAAADAMETALVAACTAWSFLIGAAELARPAESTPAAADDDAAREALLSSLAAEAAEEEAD